ncbi:MAG: hypothetical protein HYR64_01770 [Fimbriimonas ginsengisoli]|uniref:Uncharacterized protein n=1 Tax=Fimbriimonas ginsengisoli TaxID=1005039 RepID=A0A931PV30_FIMGI|nr:hypothetical protein [Fimbriimonas ginsengisoli]
MKRTCRCVAIALVALGQIVLGQTAAQSLLVRLGEAFRTASEPAKVTASEESKLRSALAQRPHAMSKREVAAIYYYFAWRDTSHTSTRKLVATLAKGNMADRDSLTAPLLAQFKHSRDPVAFKHLMTAKLDGGPAEVLYHARIELMLFAPETSARWLRARYGTHLVKHAKKLRRDAYVEDVSWSLPDEQEFDARLERATRVVSARDRAYLRTFVADLRALHRLWWSGS